MVLSQTAGMRNLSADTVDRYNNSLILIDTSVVKATIYIQLTNIDSYH